MGILLQLIQTNFDAILEEYVVNGLENALSKFNIQPGQFRRIVTNNEELKSKYMQAKLDRADTLADQIVKIADTEENWGKARNMIEARKWIASKLFPKVYSDKLDITVTEHVDLKGALDDAKSRLVLPYRAPILDIPSTTTLDELI